MSIVHYSNFGWLISHEKLIKEIYSNVNPACDKYEMHSDLFSIPLSYKQFKTRRKKQQQTELAEFEQEVRQVERAFTVFQLELTEHFNEGINKLDNNEAALQTSAEIYQKSGTDPAGMLQGANNGPPITKTIQNTTYLFPQNCKFFVRNVADMEVHLQVEQFDLILLDPPWWNKCIRRKRKFGSDGYEMMYNAEIGELPLSAYLKGDGLVAVWCTNSQAHFSALINDFFPKWGVKYGAKWYWVKVTQKGAPICGFATPPRKQPFEQIVFGWKDGRKNCPIDRKIVLSVPSALHSHKPPLNKILEQFLPKGANCLEVFSRYLLPNWTSYGNETLRLQDLCVYQKV